MTQHSEPDRNRLDEAPTVETLKTPPLRIQPAPFLKRVTACLIDSAIISLAWLVLVIALGKGIEARLVYLPYLALVTFLYYLLQEGLFASTIGKRMLKLRIVGPDGAPSSMKQSTVRNLLRFVDWIPVLYVVGAIVIATSSRKQRLGDIAAGTVVTIAEEKDINPPPAPFLFH